MTRSTWRTTIVTAALLAVAVACGGDDDADGTSPSSEASSESSSGATPDVPGSSAPAGTAAGGQTDGEAGCDATVPGSEVAYGVFSPAAGMDPIDNSGSHVGGTELAAVYDTLMRFDHESGEYVPHLAESLMPNADFTEWTLTLRDGITFSDGTPLTARIVADNMDRFLEPGVRNVSGGFMDTITDKTVVDDATLKFTLDRPWGTFPFALADEPGMIVNPNAIGDDRAAFSVQPPSAAGLGPYTVERNAPGEELVLRAKDDYWGGPVCIETLRFRYVPGSQGTYDAFRNGEFQAAYLRDPVVIDHAKEDGAVTQFIHVDFVDAVLINHSENRAGADERIREAVALAIDDQLINDRAYRGLLPASKALIAEGSPFYSDAIEAAPYDPERAKQLVEEAKADGFDGHLDLVCRDAPPTPEEALALQGLLQAVGFDVDVSVIPSDDVVQRLIDGNYEIACTGSNLDVSTVPTELRRQFHSASPSNRQRYASREMDVALDGVLAADTVDELRDAIAAVNDIVVRDSVSVGIGAQEGGLVLSPELHGVVPTVSTIFMFHDAYLDEAQ